MPTEQQAEACKPLSTHCKDKTLLNAKSTPSRAFNKEGEKKPHRNDLQFPNEHINLLN